MRPEAGDEDQEPRPKADQETGAKKNYDPETTEQCYSQKCHQNEQQNNTAKIRESLAIKKGKKNLNLKNVNFSDKAGNAEMVLHLTLTKSRKLERRTQSAMFFNKTHVTLLFCVPNVVC